MIRGEECYDLNNAYSAPSTIFGFLVRSPGEAGVNVLAFLVLLFYISTDDWVVVFKLIHFAFHVLIHSTGRHNEGGRIMERPTTNRVIIGITFGLARYVVLLTYIYRFNPYVCMAQIVAFVGLTKLRIFGEVVKIMMSYAVITYACLQQEQEGMQPQVYAGLVIGVMLQMIANFGFWLDGVLFGWRGKVWDRRDDRSLVSYHVIADIGNALFLIFADVRD